MSRCLTTSTVTLTVVAGCVRVFPGSDEGNVAGSSRISSSSFADEHSPNSSGTVDNSESRSAPLPFAHSDSSESRSAPLPFAHNDGGIREAIDDSWRITSSATTATATAEPDGAAPALSATLGDRSTTSKGNTFDAGTHDVPSGEEHAADVDHSSSEPVPVVQTLRVCWATSGFQLEKAWIIETLEASVEQTALLDFIGWSSCTDEVAADVVVNLTQNGAPPPSMFASQVTLLQDAGQVRAPAYVSIPLAEAATDISDASVEAEDGCAASLNSEEDLFVDVLGRPWLGQRHYCVASKALTEFMRFLLPDQPQYGCSPVGGEPLHPLFGYHDATSVFSECPPVGAYLSQLDRTLLSKQWGSRPAAVIWSGLGSMGRLQGLPSPVDDDRLFTEHLPVPGDSARTPVIGDFNGDRSDDIFLYGKGTLQDEIVYGAATLSWAPVETTMGGNYTPVAADFNGDGFDDILWYSATEDPSSIRYGERSVPFFREVPVVIERGHQLAAGDFDGDGYADLLVQTTEEDDFFLFGNVDGTFDTYPRAIEGIFHPLVGDFDQDGFDDIFLYREGRDADYFWWGNPNRAIVQSTDSASGSYAPTVGDFDGNGSDDILWAGALLEADPLWLFTRERGTIVKTHTSSTLERETPGDARTPFAGDFNGDQISDVFWL